MSGRGRKKKKEEEEEEGEQIKSCQMEILGFKRSETGVRVCLFKSSLSDANSNKYLCFANDLFSVRFLLDEFSRFLITLGGGNVHNVTKAINNS